MGHGDDHVLAGDEILIVHVRATLDDQGAARRAEFVAHGGQFGLDDVLDAQARRQNVEVIGDLGADLVQFLVDFVAAERRQAGKTQFEDGASLLFGEVVGVVLVDPVARIVDQADQRLDVMGRPAALHQLFAGGLRIGCATDEVDDLVDVGDRNGETDQDMGAVAGLAQQILGAAADDVLAEGHEGAQHVEQAEAAPACRR